MESAPARQEHQITKARAMFEKAVGGRRTAISSTTLNPNLDVELVRFGHSVPTYDSGNIVVTGNLLTDIRGTSVLVVLAEGAEDKTLYIDQAALTSFEKHYSTKEY
jgi:hypothetical protein